MTDIAGSVTGALVRIPGIASLSHYQRAWARPDLLAGLTVWALLVPQALAYAQLAGLDPVVGLYAAVGAILGYALFGGAREMSVGPEATIGMLTASIVGPIAIGDPSRYLALASLLALLAGGALVLAGLARLGFVARYLSRPLLVGYVTGSAITMIVSQLDGLLGVTIAAKDDTPLELVQTIAALPQTDPATLAVGLLTIAVALVGRAVDRRLPSFLVAVAVALGASLLFDLEGRGVAVVGSIAGGLPPLGFPTIEVGDLRLLALPAIAMALLVYADSGVTGQVLSRRGRYRLDADGEFFGLGAANVGASLTGGFPVNGSQSRSFTAADVGARSPVAGLVVLGLVLVTLLFLMPVFAALPKAALAAVIIVVAIGLLDISAFLELWRFDRVEFGLAVTATVIVVVVGMLAGVIGVVILSLILVAQRAARPRTTTLTRVAGTQAFRGPGTDGRAPALADVIVYRFDAPLFFANAGILQDEVGALVAGAPAPVRAVILDAEGINDVDSTGVEMLGRLVEDLRARGTTFAMARVKRPVGEALERSGVLDRIGRDRIYLEVDGAVAAFTDAAAASEPAS